MIQIETPGNGILFNIFVLPKSSKNMICGEHNGALKLKITAPPVDGAANKAAVKFLSAFFKIPKSNIQIISGHNSRTKRILLHAEKKETDRIKKIFKLY